MRTIGLLGCLAACGRIGFDADGTGSVLCTSAPITITEGITPVELCAGTSQFLLDVAAGRSLNATMQLVPDKLAAVALTVFDPDDVLLAPPTWTTTSIEATGIVTTAGLQRIDVVADHAMTATLIATTTAPPGRVLYLSPGGSDGGDGSLAGPWQTWPFAMTQLIPGDTLIVDDGTWTDRASCDGLAAPCLVTQLPRADCTTTARSGTPTAPITVIARHQRRAHLVGAGMSATMSVVGCANWRIDGLHGSSTDYDNGSGTSSGTVFSFRDVTSFVARNLLANHPNRCGNTSAISVGGSLAADATIEDSEVYDYHRIGFFASDGSNLTLRRSYAHSRDAAELPCHSDFYPTRGDAGFECYQFAQGPTCAIENVVSENAVSGIRDIDALALRISGSAALDTFHGVLITTGDQPPVPTGAPRIVDDFVCLGCQAGLWVRGVNADIRNATLVDGPKDTIGQLGQGAWADLFGGPGGNTTWTNVLALGNENTGIDIAGASWLVDYSNAFGNGVNYESAEAYDDAAGNLQHSLALAPTGIGDTDDECIVYVPATSNMRGAGRTGADIGANLVYQVSDGVTTDRKLWNQRTGEFRCGAIVPGVNDVPGASCIDVHVRLRVGVAGCAIP